MNMVHRHGRGQLALVPLAALLATALPGHAFEIDTGTSGLKVRWDNTLRYSTAVRVKDRDPHVYAGAATGPWAAGATRDINNDDGDRNFSRGLVSNRLDLYTELDIAYRDFGVRTSAAAWYDSVYNGDTDNTSPATVNKLDPSTYRRFAPETTQQHGRNAELLDLFAFGKFLGETTPVTFRVGRYSQIWGETLFFGSNGLAGGMAPTDIVKLQSVPTSTAKETTMPVGQAGGQVQLRSNLTAAAYYQFEWRANRFPALGSYFSTADILFPGAEMGYFGPFRTPHVPNYKAKDNGQFGLSLRYTPEWLDADLGVYAIRYHDKSPKLYITAPAGLLQEVYPQGIQAYGASFATNFGEAAVAGEVSLRHNMPLISVAQAANAGFDNNGNPGYAVGKSAHANVNLLYTLPRTDLWQGGTWLAEVAYNRRVSIEKRAQALDPMGTRDAYSMRTVFSPLYLNVLPGLDLSVPIGLSYTPRGSRSSVLGTGFGVENGGDFSVGVNGTYQQVWDLRLTYVQYYGTPGPGTTALAGVGTVQTYLQALSDRNFVSFSVRRTF